VLAPCAPLFRQKQRSHQSPLTAEALLLAAAANSEPAPAAESQAESAVGLYGVIHFAKRSMQAGRPPMLGRGSTATAREQHPEETEPEKCFLAISKTAFEGVEQTASWHGLAATAPM